MAGFARSSYFDTFLDFTISPWKNLFYYLLEYVVEVDSGQEGRSNSLWLLNYYRFADFAVPNFRSNGAAGQILAIISSNLF